VSADKWCIKLEWDVNENNDGVLDVIIGTPLQFDYTTGKHTWYTAKYMPVQKRYIVSGDSTKADVAYDYKESLGILGTNFRSSDCLLTYPTTITRGIKSQIENTATMLGTGDDSQVINYREITDDILEQYRPISASNVYQFRTTSSPTALGADAVGVGSDGTKNGFKVAYKTLWSSSNTFGMAKNAYIKYGENVYKASAAIPKISDTVYPGYTLNDAFSSGLVISKASSDATVANVFLGEKYLRSEYTNTDAAISARWTRAIQPLPSTWEYREEKPSGSTTKTIVTDPRGEIYYFNNAIVKIGDDPRITSFVAAAATIGPFTYEAPPEGTVLTSSNCGDYFLQYICEKDDLLDTPAALVRTNSTRKVGGVQYSKTGTTPYHTGLGLAIVASLSSITSATNDLTPTTAAAYGLTHVPAGLTPVYVYSVTNDNLYEVSYAVDYTSATNPAASSEVPGDTTNVTKDIGLFGYTYKGKYSEFVAAKNDAGSYFDQFEAEDSDGYNSKISMGDFSFPGILRNRTKSSKMFFFREHIKLDESATRPISFIVSSTTRGVFFSMFEAAADEVGNRNSWFVVQRAVKSDGTVVTTGRRPVHCVYSIMSRQPNRPWLNEDMLRVEVDKGYKVVPYRAAAGTGANDSIRFEETGSYSLNIPSPEYALVRRFIVREEDVLAPYPTHSFTKNAFGTNLDYATGGFPFGVPADKHTVDYNAVINTKQQVSISEDNKYVITFPNGLNTARYSYTHEMDMIAYTSADVISDGSEVSITVYGEATPRKYVAISANGPNNTGMRILVLKSGGGIS
jgi:hypothetical protein